MLTVSLFGERHTGTNLLQGLLALNVNASVSDSFAGHKHWLGLFCLNTSATLCARGSDKRRLLPDAPDQRLPIVAARTALAVIIIVRHPIAWLLSMSMLPYNMDVGLRKAPKATSRGFARLIRASPIQSLTDSANAMRFRNRTRFTLLSAERKHTEALCCALLCCAVLCCAVLCCAVLCCAVLCYAMLCYAMVCYDML
jgi:hypothetical protein